MDTTVHPCAGREHRGNGEQRGSPDGSPLRGQGTLAHRPVDRRHLRFTPARAGNTLAYPRRCRARPVHPCAGREHGTQYDLLTTRYGSPLRGQGTPPALGEAARLTRFTPARAGNTIAYIAATVRSSVHPCAGREHSFSRSGWICVVGSPLRGQGTQRLAGKRRLRERFTPARAGNTPDALLSTTIMAVHPCAGREHLVEALRAGRLGGSPLRGQGTLRIRQARRSRLRFTPARAGNTLVRTN